MNLIEVINLKKIFYNDKIETHAIDGVSFVIGKGEFISIMGQSGSGKSTLLQVLGFLDRHTNGKYFFEGKTIDEYTEEELAHIRNEKMGFIFQTFNLLPRVSVFENVKLPLFYSNIDESKWSKMVREAISSVGLSHRENHSPSQLSGGERQRVAIARALVNNPEIIFADEPTGNLDSKSGEQIMELVSDLNNKGHTVILITHETYTAKYGERIIKLRDGKIISDEKIRDRNNNHHFIK